MDTESPTVGSTYAEREELRASVRTFLAKCSPEPEIRRLMADAAGYDPVVWRRMATELGLLGLAVPTRFGGSGYGAVERNVVFEEAGRALLCGPFLASAGLATNVLLASGDESACAELLPAMCDGNRIATVAATGADGRWIGATGPATATPVAGGHVLDGVAHFVPDAGVADLVLVLARTDVGPSLFAVDVPVAGDAVAVQPMTALDTTRRLARVSFERAPARLVGAAGAGAEILDEALKPTFAALAAEQAGAARRTLEMAVDYAKVREQYGRIIGSFQAIKQKCADMLLAVETATSTAWAAAAALDRGAADSAASCHMALAHCSEAAVFVATENIEIHGGIGFTWEHPAHLYYKRALASAVLFGSSTAHRGELLAALGR
jgi:alkylation response protein AidB-like acyl-CoA dehydrogenase